ncbi:MAG: hypothetical protein IPI11_18450 [Haliscomenobacter sp.]|nr:hypothetical protein [Haliscomenobacter sp.]
MTSALGQNRNTPQVRFKDGVYLTLQQFQTNQPGYSWKQLRGNWFRNPESGVVTVVELIAAENAAPLPGVALGVCVDGKTCGGSMPTASTGARSSLSVDDHRRYFVLSYEGSFAIPWKWPPTTRVGAFGKESAAEQARARERLLSLHTGKSPIHPGKPDALDR